MIQATLALVMILLLLTAVGFFSIFFVVSYIVEHWDWLQQTSASGETNSETLRNVSLVVAAVLAGFLAIWRNLIADKRKAAAIEQVLATREQVAETREQNNLTRIRLKKDLPFDDI